MSEHVRNVGCLECGGVLEKTEGSHIAQCSFCGSRMFVQWPTDEIRYVLPLKLRRTQARDRLRTLFPEISRASLRDPHVSLDQDFFRGAKPARMDLFFVPFFRYSGLKVGTSPTKKEDAIRQHTEFGDPNQGETMIRTQVEVRYKVESKVVLTEVGMVLPALHLSGLKSRQWGLDALLTENDFHSSQNVSWDLFEYTDTAAEGTILNPSRDGGDVLNMCRQMYQYNRKRTLEDMQPGSRGRRGDQAGKSASALGRPGQRFQFVETLSMDHDAIDYEAGIVGDRLAVHYCPVWKVELVFKGQMYEAYLDAARGRLLSIEIPVRGHKKPWRLFWHAVAGGQFVGLVWAAMNRFGFFDSSPALFGLLTAAFLGVGYQFFQEIRNLEMDPLPGSKVFYHEDLLT